jgi:adenylosuccinate lyase
MAALLTPAEIEALRPSVERSGMRRQDSEAMRYNFSDKRRFTTWRKLCIALDESQQELGLPIRDEQLSLAVSSVDQVT